MSGGYPADVRRISGGYPAEIQRMSGGDPAEIRRRPRLTAVSLDAVSRGRLRPVVTKKLKHSFAEAVSNRELILTFKTLCRRNKKAKKRRLHYVLKVKIEKLL